MVYSQAANTLINSAWAYAQNRNNHALDVLHVMALALEHPEYAGVAADVLSTLEQPKRMSWIRMMNYELDTRSREIPGGTYPAGAFYHTPLYASCEQLWNARADALSAYAGANCALVLGTILANDQALARMAYYCEINYAWLIQALEARVQMVEGPIVGLHGSISGGPQIPGNPVVASQLMPPPSVMPAPVVPYWPAGAPVGGLPAIPAPADAVPHGLFTGPSLLARFVEPIRPTRTRVFSALHTNYVLKLGPYLSENGRARGMYILAGKRGSPVAALPQVLADRFSPESGGPNVVGMLHLGDVLDEMKRDPDAVEYLSTIAREAASQHITLIMDQLELLHCEQIDQETRECVRDELNKMSGIPPIGIYLLGENESYDQERVRLGFAGAISEAVEALDDRETRSLLTNPFLSDWERQGFAFHDREKAFDWIFRLAPYLREDTRKPYMDGDERRFLPYAVLDVGRELIATLSGNPDKQVGYGALVDREVEMSRVRNTVHALATEADRQILHLMASEQLLPAEVKEILHKAKDEIRRLANDPAPHHTKTHAQMELTRAHLMAQLLFPSGTQLRPLARSRATVAQSASWNGETSGKLS